MRGIGSLRGLATLAGVLLGWEALTWAGVAPSYVLPAPSAVLAAAWDLGPELLAHAAATFGVALAGFLLGAAIGIANAVTLVRSSAARRWLLPLLIGGQAAPAFALAPILTLWLGFGVAPILVMTVLVVYFPVTASFYDGLRRADADLLAMARVMGADDRALLWRLRAPAAYPELGSGLRLAAVFAPIAAVIGEWTGGASQGLGYLMEWANGMVRAELTFAALLTLALFGVAFHRAVSALTRRLAYWAPESTL
ncbi:MAG: ABC transporter permease [Pseudomonadota bacterium]